MFVCLEYFISYLFIFLVLKPSIMSSTFCYQKFVCLSILFCSFLIKSAIDRCNAYAIKTHIVWYNDDDVLKNTQFLMFEKSIHRFQNTFPVISGENRSTEKKERSSRRVRFRVIRNARVRVWNSVIVSERANQSRNRANRGV